jgi:hypothetical protein
MTPNRIGSGIATSSRPVSVVAARRSVAGWRLRCMRKTALQGGCATPASGRPAGTVSIEEAIARYVEENPAQLYRGGI